MLRSGPLTFAVFFSLGIVACGATHDSPADLQPAAAGAGAGASGGPGMSGASSSAGAGPSGAGTSEGGASGASGSPTASGGTLGNAGATAAAGANGGNGGEQSVSLLVFSRTVAYRHDSIPAGIQALTGLAADRGWQLAATEDPTWFSDAGLAAYNVVIFLSTTGDVLDDDQQAAFERFIRGGKGFVGIHSATDTEYDWAWYGALVGAYFREHPAIQPASVVVEDATNPATVGLPNPWQRTDEWYAFRSNPRPNVHVLLSLDESSYAAGTSTMDGDHPIAWCHEYDGGRAFYTALGHTIESYSDPLFMGQLEGAIHWVLARP